MIKHGRVSDIRHSDIRFEKHGVVHIAKHMLMEYASRQRFSRYAGVEAWCGAENPRAPRERTIATTFATPTCMLCMMNKSNELDV